MADEAETEEIAEVAPAPVPAPFGWRNVLGGLIASAVLATIAGLLALQFLATRSLDLRNTSRELGSSLETTLKNQGIPDVAMVVHPAEARTADGAVYFYSRVEVDVPGHLNAEGLENVIERSLWRDGIAITGTEQDGAARILHFGLGRTEIGEMVLRGSDVTPLPGSPADVAQPDPTPAAPLPAPRAISAADARAWTPPKSAASLPLPAATPKPRVAIIIDDGGYGGAQADIILGLDPSLTLAILPYTPQGTALAEKAATLGFEVMLHMPMENLSDTLKHEGQLNVGMPAAQIQNLTKVALAQVPFAVGVNNHMGSKYTADAAAMKPFLETVKESGLFFVDSGTTADSVAYQAAHELGIPSAARTLFLDNEDEPEAIRARVKELIGMTKEQGEAIGICHFRVHTANVLKEMLPTFAAEGIELVRASELVR